MDNVNKFGDQTKRWAFEDITAPVIAGLKVTKLTLKGKPTTNVTGEDQEGEPDIRVVSKRDSFERTIDVEGFLLDEAAFRDTESFTYDGRFWIVNDDGETYDHKALQMGSFSAVSNKKITS
jgi:hypothetical protein